MKPHHWIVLALVALGVALLTACAPVSPKVAGSAVKIVIDGGHGSGVHLGNGFFLTAAHVTEGVTSVTVKSDDGKERKGEVMWGNLQYDVSLVYVEEFSGVAASPLRCDPPSVGDEITIIGNPLGTEFAQSWGRVAGFGVTGYEKVFSNGMWRILMTMDITAAPGVSGAPVFDAYGRVVGILVTGAQSGTGAFPYTYAVPASAICHVFGRVA